MAKFKHRECSTLKELNKICRKYTAKFFGLRQTARYHKHWYTWVWVDYIGMERLNEPYLNNYADTLDRKGFPNLKHILREVKENFGREFPDRDGKMWMLCGIEISNEDYYWIYTNSEGKKKYHSCVGRYEDVY